jgi:phosphohistidine phosphatase
MSVQLWFLRHGEAEPASARPDPERRLTAKGKRQSEAAGRAMAGLEIEFDLVLTSPRVRALDTARLACRALGCDQQVHEPLSAGFDVSDARELLIGRPDGHRLLVVGHEPDFSSTIAGLTGARVDLKKGGVAALRTDARGYERAPDGAHELIVLLRPADLELMAAERGRQPGDRDAALN